MAHVSTRYPGVGRMEVSSCRTIAGTDRWSQHAFDNAVDIFGPAALLDVIHDDLRRNRGRLSMATLCWRSAGPCDPAAHQDHIHVDGAPMRIGAPPCADGAAQGVSGGGSWGADDDAPATVAGWVTDPDSWRRVGIGAAGLVVALVGVVLVSRDALAGAVIGEVIG